MTQSKRDQKESTAVWSSASRPNVVTLQLAFDRSCLQYDVNRNEGMEFTEQVPTAMK